MVEQIIELLKELQIDTYCINEIQKESFELFFVKKNLDLSRSKNALEVKLTVYRDFEEGDQKFRGSSDVFLYPLNSVQEMKDAIKMAYESAGFIKNPVFEIPRGREDQVGVIDSTLSSRSLPEMTYHMVGALYSAEGPKGTLVNSAEFYGHKDTIRIVNSSGSHVSYTKFSVEGEFVVQCKTNEADVEFYRQFSYDELDSESLRTLCQEALVSVYDRSRAEKAPEDLSGYQVILRDEDVRNLLEFYLSRGNAALIYPGYSDYAPGKVIQEGATGELLKVSMLPKVPYSEEGVPMEEKTLIQDGVFDTIHGRVSFCDYIKAPQTGTFSKIRCNNGTESIETMKTRPYLMITNFSDFQVDVFDGHFGGEFRLAYLFDGTETKVLTGGTFSGDIFKAQQSLVFSTEEYRSANYIGPKAVMFTQ